MSARKLAVTLLDQTESKGSYSNIALDAALEKEREQFSASKEMQL